MSKSPFLLLCLAFCLALPSHAQGVLFVDGFESPFIAPLFPRLGDEYLITGKEGPAGGRLDWLLDQLEPGAPIADAEITANFATSWFDSGQTLATTRSLIESIRAVLPNGYVNDLIALSPMEFVGVMTGDSDPDEYFVTLQTNYAQAKITSLSVVPFGAGDGTVIYPADANLTLAQAADQFANLSAQPRLFAGRINRQTGQCYALEQRAGTSLGATASLFKIWVLGATVDAVATGAVNSDTLIPRTDAERTPGGPLIHESNDTLVSVDALARLMMGMSDNTATDLLHEWVGRSWVDDIVQRFGHTTPTALTPTLATGEQFHLFFSFSAADANAYVDGGEAQQRAFITNRIEPLGSFADSGGGFNNESLFLTGSWRASPVDICQAFAAQRQWSPGSDALALADRALGAAAAQPNIRSRWDRVWYKGGSLVSSTNGNVALNHAWLLENAGDDPYVLVAMSNDQQGNLDGFAMQSITGRMLALLAGDP